MDNGKKKLKLAVDILMTLTLLFLMGYQLWGESAHEWAGAFMLILFIVHHVLNGAWYRNLFRAKYTGMTVLINAVDLILLATMVCLMASGNCHVSPCLFISPHQWRNGNSQTDSHGCLLLGLCADGVSPGSPLEHDAGAVSADVRNEKNIWSLQSDPAAYGLYDSRIRAVCICDKSSGGLYVPVGAVCVPGLQ